MKKLNKILMWVALPSLAITLITSIPLTIHYFRGTEVPLGIMTDFHVIFGILFGATAIARLCTNRKMIKALLTN